MGGNTDGVTVRVEGLDKRLDKLEKALEERDDRIYRRINGVTIELRSDITRLQSTVDARLTRQSDSINQQFIKIAGQIGGLKSVVSDVPGEVTQAKINIAEIKAAAAAKKKSRSSIPPSFNPRRFFESPWVKMGAGFALGLVMAAGYIISSGVF